MASRSRNCEKMLRLWCQLFKSKFRNTGGHADYKRGTNLDEKLSLTIRYIDV